MYRPDQPTTVIKESREAIIDKIYEQLGSNEFLRSVTAHCKSDEEGGAYLRVNILVDKTTGVLKHLDAISNPMYRYDPGGLQALQETPRVIKLAIDDPTLAIIEVTVYRDFTIGYPEPVPTYPPSQDALTNFSTAVEDLKRKPHGHYPFSKKRTAEKRKE